MIFKPRRKERYVKTINEWYPNFENDMVHGTAMLLAPYKENILVRLCYWGADDIGIEKDFNYDATKQGYKDANKKYQELKKELLDIKIVDKYKLLKEGFIPA
jgi:hypothetical protein